MTLHLKQQPIWGTALFERADLLAWCMPILLWIAAAMALIILYPLLIHNPALIIVDS